MSFIGTYPTNTIKRATTIALPPPAPTLVSIASTSPFVSELDIGYFREYALTVGLSLEIPDVFSNFQDIVKFSVRKAKELLKTTIIEKPEREDL